MSNPLLARIMLTALAAGQSLVPLYIDLKRLRANRPNLPGNARSRFVKQRQNPAMAGLVEVILIWWPGPAQGPRFYLVAILTAIPLAAFFATLFWRRLREILEDPNRLPRPQIRIFGRTVKYDINAVLVPLGAILLLGAVYLY